MYSRLAMCCSIFCGIGGRLWAGAEVPGVPTTLVDRRLGPGVGVKPTPSWTAVALFAELIVLVGMALEGGGGWVVAGDSAELWTGMESCGEPTRLL